MVEFEEYIRPVDALVNVFEIFHTNFAGHPSVVLPRDFSDLRSGGKRPVPMTLTGQLNQDDKLLAIAHAVQNELTAHLQQPPLDDWLVKYESGNSTRNRKPNRRNQQNRAANRTNNRLKKMATSDQRGPRRSPCSRHHEGHPMTNRIDSTAMICGLCWLAVLATAPLNAQSNSNEAQAKTEPLPGEIDAKSFSALKFRNIGPFRGGRCNAITGVVGQPMTYYMGSTGEASGKRATPALPGKTSRMVASSPDRSAPLPSHPVTPTSCTSVWASTPSAVS